MKTETTQWIRQSITLKLILIGIISLALMIPNAMIQGLISDREEYAEQARNEVSSKWGQNQVITGPVLTIPYIRITWSGDKKYENLEYAHFLPDQLSIKGEINPSLRYRNIYEVLLYETSLQITGEFHNPDFSPWSIPSSRVRLKDAYLSIGIPDLTGLQNLVKVDWNGIPVHAESGVPDRDLFSSGLTFRISLDGKENYRFSTELLLNGSGSLRFVPAGKVTDLILSSPYPDPSFQGNFLPDCREVTDTGFTASWNILHVNRNYPQQWLNDAHSFEESDFGVDLFIPVDEYQKNMRSTKYSIMFIVLTFMVFFFSEILNRKRIHPVQYLLTGSALVIFYILLLSLSEHLSYNLAYLVAATATVGLISFYAASCFRSVKPGLITGLILILLYGFLFSLVQLAELALLLGSIGIFLSLAFIMFISRNINWYEDISGEK